MAQQKGIEEEELDLNSISLDWVASLGSEHIYEYMLHVSLKRKNGASARARKLVAIREFYKYLTREKIIKDNPAADISTPTVKQALPKFLTLEESIRLLECISSDTNNPNRVRDYAMIIGKTGRSAFSVRVIRKEPYILTGRALRRLRNI